MPTITGCENAPYGAGGVRSVKHATTQGPFHTVIAKKYTPTDIDSLPTPYRHLRHHHSLLSEPAVFIITYPQDISAPRTYGGTQDS